MEDKASEEVEPESEEQNVLEFQPVSTEKKQRKHYKILILIMMLAILGSIILLLLGIGTFRKLEKGFAEEV